MANRSVFKKILRYLLVAILLFVGIFGTAYLLDRNSKPPSWNISPAEEDSDHLAWSPFEWAADSLGNKLYNRSAMFIPARFGGLPYRFKFQFDLGAYTVLYGKNLSAITQKHPELANNISRLKNPFLFWNHEQQYRNPVFRLGDIRAERTYCPVMKNYGEAIDLATATDSNALSLGTIGADMFQHKVLIIDYPGRRFATGDRIPVSYQTKMVDIELDGQGRIILPMRFKNKPYRVLFDNGSSLFPLMALEKNAGLFASGPDVDTISTWSWGQLHNITGKQMTDSFELGGRKFAPARMYINHAGLGIARHTDAMAGNALFWDDVLVIDLVHKKFGVATKR